MTQTAENYKAFLDKVINAKGNEEGTVEIKQIAEMFEELLEEHGEEFVQRKILLNDACEVIKENIAKVNGDKVWESYSDIEFMLCELNDLIAETIYMQSVYEDMLENLKDETATTIRANYTSEAATNRAVNSSLVTYISKVERSGKWLKAIEKKAKGYERIATHLKDHFYHEGKGTGRTA